MGGNKVACGIVSEASHEKGNRRQWPGCYDEQSYAQKLREQLKRHIKIDARTGCWSWTASLQRNGYAQTRAWGKMMPAHRASFIAFNGKISAGLEVCHSCDNKKCINPDHLSLGTHRSNMRDAAERGLMRSGSRHHNFGKPSAFSGINNPASRPIKIGNTVYGSLKEAERALGLGSGTARSYVTTGRARLISKEDYLNGE